MPRKTNNTVNGNDYFLVTATIGKRPDGSNIRKYFRGKSKSAAEDKRDEFLNDIKNGLRIDYREMTIQELMQIWLFNVVKVNKAANTFDRYESVYRNYVINSPVAGLKVYEVQRLTLQTYYSRMRDSGYSDSQVFHFNKLLKTFFNYAVAEDYILKNPCVGIEVSRKSSRPDVGKGSVDPFTDEEIKLIRDTAEGSMRVLFQLGLGTGLRRGELIGLRMKDLDLENAELTVNVALTRVKEFTSESKYEYVTRIDSPKTEGSKRTVSIPTALIPILEQHIEFEKAKHKELEISHNDDSLLFTSETCTPYWGKNVLTAFQRLLKRAGVRYRCFHNIRHTFATKLFEEREPTETISKLLGHANTAITANVYISVMPKEKARTTEKLNRHFQ